MNIKILFNFIFIWNLLNIVFILFMIIGHLVGDEIPFFNFSKDFLTFLCFPIGLCMGNILAIKWRQKGGFVTVISLIGLFLLRPDLILVPVFLILGLPSILMLFFNGKIIRNQEAQ